MISLVWDLKREQLPPSHCLLQENVAFVAILDTPSFDASIRRNKCLRVLTMLDPKRYGYQNLR